MHDLAATSNAAKIFLMKQQKNSVILNLKIIPFDQKNLNKNYVSFLFLSQYIFQLLCNCLFETILLLEKNKCTPNF